MKNEMTFIDKNDVIVHKSEEDVVNMLVTWAISGEELSTEDAACINNAKSNFESSFKLRSLVFEAMHRVALGSDAWKRLFAIA